MPILSTLLTGAACFTTLILAQSSCNPTLTSCPAQPGLTTPFTTDFTSQTTLPPGWTLAAYENVTYGPNGAEFTFNQPPDSPYIWTTDYFLFGKIDVVAQAAPGVGIISSIVLISDDLDEVDWEFSGNNFAQPQGTVQTNYFGKGVTGSYDRGTQPQVAAPQTEFHTYSWEWTAESLTWSVDGVVLRALLASDADSGEHQYPQTPMQLHLGLWDAGCATCAAGTVDWSGGLTDISLAPFTFYVKSVSITPGESCASYSYGDMSGSAESIVCGGGDGATGGDGSGTTPSSPTSPTGGPSAADQNETVTLADPDCTTTDTGFIPAGTEAAAAYASASAYASAYACAGSDCSTNSDSSSDTTATAGASASASAYATDAASAGGAVASESGSGTIGPVASYTPTPGSASQLGGERLMKTSGVLGVVALGFAFFI